MSRNTSFLPDLWRSGARSPFREVSRLQRNIERMFDEFLAPTTDTFWSPTLTSQTSIAFNPACDIDETDSHYMLSFDLPGVSKNDVKIEMRDNQLVVSGQRKEEHEMRAGAEICRERDYGSFMRSFTLPSAVDADKIEANFHEGVLRVAIAKSEAVKPKVIEVKEGKAGVISKLLGKEKAA